MPSITVCTGWNQDGWETYGKRFAEDFAAFWPREVGLVVFGEEPQELPRGRMVNLPHCVVDFIRRNDTGEKKGTSPLPGWRPKHHDRGYCFKFDAVKFCRMAMIPHHVESEITVWLDGDVRTTAPITVDWLASIIGDAPVTYLGRKGYHSETGFVAFRWPTLKKLWHDFYHLDAVFNLPEWHSAYVFDQAMNDLKVEGKNLTPDWKGGGDVWASSPLIHKMVHLKGKRKYA